MNQAFFTVRNVPASPTAVATAPPISIQTALSVGEPVKKRETSELNEFVAVMPIIIRTMPPTSRARDISLFITVRGCSKVATTSRWQDED
jgi:hypothetical protein